MENPTGNEETTVYGEPAGFQTQLAEPGSIEAQITQPLEEIIPTAQPTTEREVTILGAIKRILGPSETQRDTIYGVTAWGWMGISATLGYLAAAPHEPSSHHSEVHFSSTSQPLSPPIDSATLQRAVKEENEKAQKACVNASHKEQADCGDSHNSIGKLFGNNCAELKTIATDSEAVFATCDQWEDRTTTGLKKAVVELAVTNLSIALDYGRKNNCFSTEEIANKKKLLTDHSSTDLQ